MKGTILFEKKTNLTNILFVQQRALVEVCKSDGNNSCSNYKYSCDSLLVFNELDFKGVLWIRKSLRHSNVFKFQSNVVLILT